MLFRSERLVAGQQKTIAKLQDRIRQIEKGTTPQTEGLEFEATLCNRLRREFPDDIVRHEGSRAAGSCKHPGYREALHSVGACSPGATGSRCPPDLGERSDPAGPGNEYTNSATAENGASQLIDALRLMLVAAGGIEPPRGDYETPALPLSYAAGKTWKDNFSILP